MREKIILAIFLFSSGFVLGQEPAYKNYTTKNGMPPYNYFYVGYTNDTLFISTDEVGLYCFDGIDFQKLKSPPSKYMFRDIHFLKKGYFMRNTMNHYWYRRLNSDWQTIKKPENNIVWHNTLLGFNADSIFYFDEDSIRWRFKKKSANPKVNVTKYHPYIYYDNTNNEILTLRTKDPPEILYDIFQDTFVDHNNIRFRCEGIVDNELVYLDEKQGYFKWNFLSDNIVDLKKFLPEYTKTPFFIINKFKPSDDFVKTNIVHQENSLNFFTFDTLSGVNYSGTMNIPRANYQKIREDLYFIGSFEGLYKVNPNIAFYSPSNSGINKNVRSIIKHNGKIWTGGYGSGFCKLNQDGFVNSSSTFQKGNYKNILSGGFAVSDNEAWFFNEGYNRLLNLKENKVVDFQEYINGKRAWDMGFYIDTLNDGRLAFSLQHDNFGILDSVVENRVYIKSIAGDKGIKIGNSWSFDQDKKGRIWLSRYTAGIAVYDIVKDTVISFDYNLDVKKSFGVMSMYIDIYDRIWLGTTNGLYIVSSISDFDIYNDDIFDKTIHIELPNSDRSLVSSIKKVGKYIVSGNKTGISFIQNRGSVDSILTNPIHQLIYGEDINGSRTERNCMYFDNKRYLWVSTINGVLRIDMRAIKVDTTSVEIEFYNIKNADNYLNIKDNEIEINPVKRNIEINFIPKTNPSFCNNIYYEYILTNSNSDTISYQHRSKNNKFSIDYLSPDSYKFEVKAFKNGVLMDTAGFNIIVPYTFGENPWMWLLLTGMGLGILSIFLFYRKEHIKQISKKEIELSKTEKEKEKLKVQAVISAFNPHFINNSLHWVQSRYYKDPDMINMIDKLSKNIYYIFNKAKDGNAIHKLKDEINIVNNYITIQKIRFGDSFKLIMPDESTLEKYSDIPIILMQIQIHVENAIEHGIRNRPESTFVEIDIKEDKNNYIISITDDGIGRNITKKLKSGGSKSGIKMLKELHSIFNNNPKNIHKITSRYEDDIFEENGVKFGTRVIIEIPKGFVFEIG